LAQVIVPPANGATNTAPIASPAALPLLTVNAQNITALRTLRSGSTRAVSLGVTLEQLAADEMARTTLLTWVRAGGIVFVHTDAAQEFGYNTIPVREGNERLAGNMLGRARSVIPFGAHPLLMGNGGASGNANANNGASMEQPSSQNGRQNMPPSLVRSIYYRAEPGDHWVTQHQSGVGLLQVDDVAGGQVVPLYAAAVASYGRGWAVFTPTLVETERADGALFTQNLLRFAGVQGADAGTASAVTAGSNSPAMLDRHIEIPAVLIDQAALGQFNAVALSNALMGVLTRQRPIPAPGTDDIGAIDGVRTVDEAITAAGGVNEAIGDADPAFIDAPLRAGLVVTTGELMALQRAIAANEAERSQVLLLLMRMRLALQSADYVLANNAFQAAFAVAPDAAETLLWGGILSAAKAENRLLASPVRASLLEGAVEQWNLSLRAPLLAPPALVGPSNTVGGQNRPAMTVGMPTLGGVSRSMVALWIRNATYAGRLYSAEPPLLRVVGNGFLVRYFVEDQGINLAIPAAAQLAQLSRPLGMETDQKELVLFPNAQYYAVYRAAAGLQGPTTPAPGSIFGDVVGDRMLMISVPSTFVLVPPANPSEPYRQEILGNVLPGALARLHAQVLINQIAGDGAPVPAWITIGLASLSEASLPDFHGNPLGLNVFGQQGGRLLTPQQFEQYAAGSTQGTRPVNGVADLQAQRLVNFFYTRFGSGSFVATLQLIGAGDNINTALLETTGLNEQAFFQAWAEAEL
jgi:hypothetical protein